MIETKKRHWPVIIDFEASGLGVDSYPIEVAWTCADGSAVESHLINPDTAPPAEGWTEWSWASQAIHGISIDELRKGGKPVIQVAQRMNTALQGTTVYSDAPGFDCYWCERLFCATDLEMEFAIANFWDLVRPFGINETEMNRLRELTCSRIPGAGHRAGIDALRLLELLKIATREFGDG